MSKFKLAIALTICVIAAIVSIIFIITNKKELVIKLDSNPSTGYAWTYAISDSNIIKVEEKYEDDCQKNVTGCGGQNIYSIKPLKKGKVTIVFKYSRSWEKETDELTAVYEITVGDNLKITESHDGSYFDKSNE